MIRPTPEVTKALAACVNQYPALADWLAEWRQHELEQLPNVAQEKVTLAQGRCQILSELSKFVSESPEIAAKSL
jgi:hypothetical protein